MKIVTTVRLDEIQKKEALDLILECKKVDGENLPFFLDNGENSYPNFKCFYLGYESEKLVAMISVFQPDGFVCWVYAHTHPDYRKQGYFKALYQEFLPEFKFFGLETATFPVIPVNNLVSKVLPKFEGYFFNTEYIMEYDLIKAMENGRDKKLSELLEGCDLTFEFSGEDFLLLRPNIFKRPVVIGTCKVTPVNEEGTSFCLSHFRITERFRGKGYGKIFLAYTLLHFMHIVKSKGLKECVIALQVDGRNKSAYNLYTHQGFEITQSLDFWNIENDGKPIPKAKKLKK